jgi:hypothetical protein
MFLLWFFYFQKTPILQNPLGFFSAYSRLYLVFLRLYIYIYHGILSAEKRIRSVQYHAFRVLFVLVPKYIEHQANLEK